MIADRRQKFNEAFASLKSFNMRRAFVSTQYGLTRTRHFAEDTKISYDAFERIRRELSLIDDQASSKYVLLRKFQTRYLVEYEAEEVNTKSRRLVDKVYSEQLYLFSNCEVNTFENGWDMEDSSTQDLLYEIAEFILQYKTGKYLIKNVRKL